MVRKRKRLLKWVLLFREEDGKSVYIYDALRKKQIETKLKNGWEVIE